MGVEENEHSATGVTERVNQKSAIHQPYRNYGGDEGNVPGCNPDGHGGGAG